MNEAASWTSMEKVLFTSLVPLLGVACMLVVTSYIRADNHRTLGASSSGLHARRSAADDARHAEREAFETCMKGSGAAPRSGFTSRFASRPSAAEVREAIAICRTVVLADRRPPPVDQAPAGPPVA